MIKEITSKSNAYIKDLVKLKQKKNRSNLFLIEGERFVGEAIKRGVKMDAILAVDVLAYLEKSAPAELIKISPEIAESLSSTVSPSGVFAVVDFPLREFREPESNFLVLDNISDPGNLGTIIRTALAFGFRDIYLYNCVDWRNPKVLRSTMGTIFDVNLFEVDFEEVQRVVSKFPVFKADMSGENLFDFEPKFDIIGVVLGNEANGVSPEIDELVIDALAIPMKNNVESLNVATAGAIIMSKLVN